MGQNIKLEILLDYERTISVAKVVMVENLPRTGEYIFTGLVPADVLPLQALEVRSVCHNIPGPFGQGSTFSTVVTHPASKDFNADVVAAALVDAGWALIDRAQIVSARDEFEGVTV